MTAIGGTVGDVLDSEGIELGEHDVVAPGVDEKVTDGSRITVRFGRPLELSVDGNEQTYWVTSTKVADALGEIGRRFAGADLSTSRGGSIDREGLSLEVVTPKTLRVKLADHRWVKREITALTVEDALAELKVKVEKQDQMRPAPGPQADRRRPDPLHRLPRREQARRPRGPRLRHRPAERLLAAGGQVHRRPLRRRGCARRDLPPRLPQR